MAKVSYDPEVRARANTDGKSLALISVDSRSNPEDGFGAATFEMPVTPAELREIVKFATGLMQRRQRRESKLTKEPA